MNALDGVVVLLDLDGTLTESAPGILASMTYAARKLGLNGLPEDAQARFVGPPLHDNMRALLSTAAGAPTQERIEQGVAFYREHYVPIGMFINELYEGVPAMVAQLHDLGATLAVATSKPEPYAVEILEHFGLADAFVTIAGSSLDGARSAKADIIAEALRRFSSLVGNAASIDRVLMVGDRSHDVHGAAAHGIRCLGAAWGYGSVEELTSAGAVTLVASALDLPAAVITQVSGAAPTAAI